jgi:hypothetical protein
MTTVRTILEAARAKIAEPEHWCQHAFATTKDDMPCGTLEPDAVKWCATGTFMSLDIADTAERTYLLDKVLDTLRSSIPGRNYYNKIEQFNDSHTHAEVLDLFDKAIASLEG